VIVKRRPKGPVAGASPVSPRSPKQRAALRTNGYAHGRRAVTVTREEAMEVKLARSLGREDAPAIVKAFVDGMAGDLTGLEAVTAGSLAEQELLRRDLHEKLEAQGSVLTESVTDADGRIIASRIRVHPAVEAARKLAEGLGQTAAEQRLTRKSRGEGERDAAVTAMLRRDALLASGTRRELTAPPEDDEEAIETEVVEGSA